MTLVLVARTCRRSPRARDGAVCAPHGARRTHLQTELETRIVARKQRIRQRLGHRRGAGRRAERDLPALRASALRRGRSGFRAVGRAPRRRRRRDLEAPGPRGHGRERAAFPRFRPCLSRGLGAGRDNYAMPWPVTEALLLKFVAHHLWDPARRESDARHGMPAEVADQLREDGFLRADGPHAPGTVRRRLSAPPTAQSRPALPRPRRPRRSGSAPCPACRFGLAGPRRRAPTKPMRREFPRIEAGGGAAAFEDQVHRLGASAPCLRRRPTGGSPGTPDPS